MNRVLPFVLALFATPVVASDIWLVPSNALADAIGEAPPVSGDDVNAKAVGSIIGGLAQKRSAYPANEEPGYSHVRIGDVSLQSLLVDSKTPQPNPGKQVAYSSYATSACVDVGQVLRLDIWVKGTAKDTVKLICSPSVGYLDGPEKKLPDYVCYDGPVPADGETMNIGKNLLTYKHRKEGQGMHWRLAVDVKRADTGEAGRLYANYFVECRSE
jgi:hypothetical protein